MARNAVSKPKKLIGVAFMGWNTLLDQLESPDTSTSRRRYELALLRQADVVRDFEQPGRFGSGSRAAFDPPGRRSGT